MMTRLRSRRVRWATRPPQGGYVLVTVLAFMLLCVIVVASLLSLTSSTVQIEESGRVRERQVRAAESAVDVAINQIRNSPAIAAAKPLQRKTPGDTGYLNGKTDSEQPIKEPGDSNYDATRDPNVNRGALAGVCDPVDNLIEVDTYKVRVYCYNDSYDGLWQYDQDGTPVAGIPQDDGATAIRLVGDNQYVGDPGTTAEDHVTDPAAVWRTSTSFPFSTAVTSGFNTTELTNTKGQFLASSPFPLRVVGGVEVRNQIAAVSTAATGPAMDVAGTVRQGGKGMFDSATGKLDCGIAKSNDANNSPRADINSDSVYSPIGEGLQCNQPDVGSMTEGGLVPPDGEWDNARVQSSKYFDWDGVNGKRNSVGNYDALPTDCDQFIDSSSGFPSSVFVLEPGAYDAKATKVLNYFFKNCDNRTWYFPSGNYWFDVNDPSLAESDPAKHSLVLNNRTSSWVFGKMSSNSRPALSAFPDQACNRGNASAADGYSGTSITLSARTGLHHRAGRVQICGPIATVGGHSTAIFQRPATSLGARLLPTGMDTGQTTFTPNNNAVSLQELDGTSIRAETKVIPSCWDSGTCEFTHSFKATNFGVGGPNGSDPGTGAVNSIWVDLTADGELVANPAQDRARTRLDVTLKNGTTTCFMEYGPNKSVTNRLADNYSISSYNLLDNSVNGDCDSVLSGVDRSQYRGASIKVTYTLNPPKMTNTRFSWWDWWPWWRDNVVKPLCNAYTNSQLDDWLTDNIGLINWYISCDDRPTTIAYSVDSIALRLGWTPSFDAPVDAATTGSCPNCLSWDAASVPNGVRTNADGTANTGYATVTKPANFNTNQTASYSNLRFKLKDPTLLDGFLPLRDVNFEFRIRRPDNYDTTLDANDSVRFTLKTTDGVWCRRTVLFKDINNNSTGSNIQSLSQPLKVRDGYVEFNGTQVLRGCGKPSNTANGLVDTDPEYGEPGKPEVQVGQIVTHTDDFTTNPGWAEVPAYMDVEVVMANRAVAKTVQVDFVNMTATAGEADPSNTNNALGYPRPLDPVTITWNPMTPNNDGDPCCSSDPTNRGDATFTVFGSVSVPNNDVRVIWNYDTTRYAGPTGFPIFNAGNVEYQNCNPSKRDGCKPALVASAFASWGTTSTNGYNSTTAWPTLTNAQQPDPLASTGDYRPAVRQVRLHACVVDPDGGGTDGDLLPRVKARVLINDRASNKAIIPGAKVWVDQWEVLDSSAYQTGESALTNECDTPV